MIISRFEDIIAWKKAKDLTLHLYQLFSKHNDFGFRDQLLRASVSIMNNIAEGFERKSDKEIIQFLFIAKGSAAEVRSMLHLAHELKYISKNDYDKLTNASTEIGRILSGLIKSITKKISSI